MTLPAAGVPLTRADALSLAACESPAEIMELAAAARRHQEAARGTHAAVCALVSVRTGGCPEDCSYCAQSIHWAAPGTGHQVTLPSGMIVARAVGLATTGADHVCLVSSGRGPSDPELQILCDAVRRIRATTGMEVCACLGLIDEAAAAELKAAGVVRYNHNLETARSFYPTVCRTHSWEDRLDTARAVKRAGLELCCGGIIGLGETPAQRLELAFELAELTPDVVPLNILNPRPRTPVANVAPLTPLEVLKYVALFRLIIPRADLKLAGGREQGLGDLQGAALLGGANGLIIGGYLTTAGRPVDTDLAMLRAAGLTLTASH